MELPPREFSPNPGDTLLFENDRVRVWTMTVGPHEEFGFHQHHHDHIVIWPWAGDIQAQNYLPQEYGAGVWSVVQKAEPGFVMFKTVGTEQPLVPHRVRNVRDETVTHLIVELLDRSPSAHEKERELNDRGSYAEPDRARS